MSSTPCQHCAALIPAENRFCGSCGAPVGGGPAPAVPSAARSAARRYRGPLWVGGIGTVLFVGGAGLVTVILGAVQVEAAPGLLVDIFGPAVQDQVDNTIGDGVVDLGGESADDVKTLGLLTLAGLLGGAVLAAVGLLLVIIACAWGANRGFGARRSGVVTIATPPPPVQYPAPTFAPPTPATYTPSAPPAPHEAPTVVVPPPPAPVPTFSAPPPSGPPVGPQDPPTFVKPPR